MNANAQSSGSSRLLNGLQPLLSFALSTASFTVGHTIGVVCGSTIERGLEMTVSRVWTPRLVVFGVLIYCLAQVWRLCRNTLFGSFPNVYRSAFVSGGAVGMCLYGVSVMLDWAGLPRDVGNVVFIALIALSSVLAVEIDGIVTRSWHQHRG